ncbi:DUF397 domain-containing protein [Streptomyces sp. GC420]|uniref:DUF397 domain-containing protein n=1 Tax=Streptomyces sp. GC420 TaxID=2697568 RepID=UPI001414FE1C|nr:DUF397 domain-containing protein [Streptomyces sp. GC420]NBM17692.1 DUF397 domain-containing protein [Streptomyces sp. GC420]
MSPLPQPIPQNDSPSITPSTRLRGARWRRSSRSTGMNNCVETAGLGTGLLAVRDSKNTAGPALLFSSTAWTSFLTLVQQRQDR